MKQFCLYVRNCDIEHVRLDDVVSWFGLLKTLQWQHNSFITKATALRKFFEFYKMQSYRVLEPNLIPLPPKQYRLPRVASEENFRKLLSIIPVVNDPRHIRNKALIMLLWDTGARNGEIVSLDEDDVDTIKMRAVISTEKSNGRRPFREIFWTEETNEALKAWLSKRENLKKTKMPHMETCLFSCICSSGSLGLGGRRMTNKVVAEFLRRYSNRAGIPYLNAHSFRHHMGHDIISQGGSAADVMNILGHASLESSSIYTMMAGKELEERYKVFKGRKSST